MKKRWLFWCGAILLFFLAEYSAVSLLRDIFYQPEPSKKTELLLPSPEKFSFSQAERDINRLIAKNREWTEKRLKEGPPYTLENFLVPSQEAGEEMGRVAVFASNMFNLMKPESTPEGEKEIAAFMRMNEGMTSYGTWLSQNEDLYRAYQHVASSSAYSGFSEAWKTDVSNSLRGFRLSGIGLPKEAKERLEKIERDLTVLSSEFSNNESNSEKAWKKCVDVQYDLSGIPEDVLASLREDAEKKGCSGYLLTLGQGTVDAVLSYANNREVRKEIQYGYATRASDIGAGGKKYDNLPNIEKIMALRQEEAHLLGFKNFAELSLATKMARTTDEVMGLLDNTVLLSQDKAAEFYKKLSDFAKERDGIETLEPWDIAYYQRLLKEKTFSFSEEKVRAYFPLPKVLGGMFDVAHKLYGIRFTEKKDVPAWNKDVRFYEVRGKDGALIAGLYLDLFDRSGQKRGGAWADALAHRYERADGVIQLPVGLIATNFKTPPEGKPALLTMRDTETLFHEFGHNLENLLTRVSVLSVSGHAGIPWDGIELPSQFMEKFVWESEVIGMISSHYQTGEKLPPELFEKLRSAKEFGAGLFVARQMILAEYDFRLHRDYISEDPSSIHSLYRDLVGGISPVPYHEWSRFPETFSHIFDGGYSAGYYSYWWANVLAADAFGTFVKEGNIDWVLGERFEKEILSRGGSRPFMDSFIAFLGRKPTPDALLRQYGLTK